MDSKGRNLQDLCSTLYGGILKALAASTFEVNSMPPKRIHHRSTSLMLGDRRQLCCKGATSIPQECSQVPITHFNVPAILIAAIHFTAISIANPPIIIASI
jgi:hypothetical protein